MTKQSRLSKETDYEYKHYIYSQLHLNQMSNKY